MFTNQQLRAAQRDIQDPQWYRRSSGAARAYVYATLDEQKRAEDAARRAYWKTPEGRRLRRGALLRWTFLCISSVVLSIGLLMAGCGVYSLAAFTLLFFAKRYK